jgi:Tfp pilus assembly protein PilF
MGYEPVVIDITVAPGTPQTVPLRLLRQRVVKPGAQALYDEGESIWRRSGATPADMVRAADRFTKALKEDPAFSPAALGLCRVQRAQGKPDAALKSCAKAIDLDADYLEAREEYGAVLMETGDYGEAVRQLQQGAIAAPKDSFVHSMLAEALYLADRPQEAETQANKAIELDGGSAQGYLLRGEARRSQKRFTEAAADYHRALDLEEYGSSHLRVAAFFLIGSGMTKHRSGRRSLYRTHAASAWFGLCACEMDRENYLLAVKDCRKALAIEPDDPDSYMLLGEVYTRLFNTDNSRDYLVRSRDGFENALRLNPNYERAPELRNKLREIDALLAKVH